MATEVVRKGGKVEALGFVLIASGMVGCMAGHEGGGGAVFAIGFVVFIVGRFM